MHRAPVLTIVGGLLLGCSSTSTPTSTTTALPSCTFALSIGANQFPCGGGCTVVFPSSSREQTANVVTAPACGWSVSSSAEWLTTSPSSGTGTGSFRFSAAANQDSMRLGLLTLAGSHIDVFQSGARPCTYTLTPMNVPVPAAGGAATIDQIASSNGCASTVAASVSWLTILQPVAQGSVLIRFSAASNPGAAARSGSILVTPCPGTDGSDCEGLAPISVMVTQAGAS